MVLCVCQMKALVTRRYESLLFNHLNQYFIQILAKMILKTCLWSILNDTTMGEKKGDAAAPFVPCSAAGSSCYIGPFLKNQSKIILEQNMFCITLSTEITLINTNKMQHIFFLVMTNGGVNNTVAIPLWWGQGPSQNKEFSHFAEHRHWKNIKYSYIFATNSPTVLGPI